MEIYKSKWSKNSSKSKLKFFIKWKTEFSFNLNPIYFFLNHLTSKLNRFTRGLETCPQAKTSKSGHAIFFAFFRRVRATSMTQRRVVKTRVHFWTCSPVSVKEVHKVRKSSSKIWKITEKSAILTIFLWNSINLNFFFQYFYFW